MRIFVYDPKPYGNEYATFYFNAIRAFSAKAGSPIDEIVSLDGAKNCGLLILSDYLTDDVILKLKNNGVRIIAFNVTDSSYISGACRYAPHLKDIDLMFSLTGIQTVNSGKEFEIAPDFDVSLVRKEFLPDLHWRIFTKMHDNGQLQSLPYVPWHPFPDSIPQPYSQRSQKVLIRGGGHARRFILALFLMKHEFLDVNSGMVLSPYFADGMNPAFRFCAECRAIWKSNHKFPAGTWISPQCENPHAAKVNLSHLGEWNNKCPASFFRMANKFSSVHGSIPADGVETLLNAKWLHPDDNMALLSRITFTSDLKWLFSIYMAQRFWEAASAGCINLLPLRTNDQEYFPDVSDGTHYLTYNEDMTHIEDDVNWMNEVDYNHISHNAMETYRKWIKPSDYAINTNLLSHIMANIKLSCAF